MRMLGFVWVLVAACSGEVANEAPPREGTPEDALRACAHAQSRSAAMPPGAAADLVAKECAGLFTEPACSDGWKRWTDVPVAERAATVTRACARAYCPILTDDPPVICEIPEDQWTASRLPALNGELTALALAHDWKQPLAADLREQLRTSAAAVHDKAPASVFPTALPQTDGIPVLRLVAAEGGGAAILQDGDQERHFELPRQKAELTEALRALPNKSADLVVNAHEDVAFSAVRDAMDAAVEAGRTNVSYALERRP